MRKMLSTAVVLGLSGLLIGCPAPGKTGKTGTKTGTAKTGDAKTEAEAAPKKVDLSHVKKGQTYTYEMDASGNKMVMKYVVLEVTETTVKYDTINVIAGNENKSPTPTEWKVPAAVAPASPAASPAVETKTTEETVEAGGMKWECKVYDSNGNKTWVPTKNGIATFPPSIKSEGAAMKMMLTKVE